MYTKRLSLYLALAITIYGCIQPPKKDVRVNSFYAAPTVSLTTNSTGTSDTLKVDTAASKSKSKSRGVIIGPDAPPTNGDNSNLLFGNPSNATINMVMADNYLMDMGYYIESYNNSRGGPNWVSWHLDATNITTTAKRVNNFAAFKDLPASFYPVQNTSYTSSGFDRGHNCPSADRSSSANANSSTFLMVNIPKSLKITNRPGENLRIIYGYKF